MKRILAILAIAISGFAVHAASAQTTQRPHVANVAYAGTFNTSCYINGVAYPVDNAYYVWARNGYGNWFIIGQIVNNGYGYYFLRSDGVRLAASCY
jgi:hypothetical protein